jgi:glycosyltransferase involved in cell wall biosynthesis
MKINFIIPSYNGEKILYNLMKHLHNTLKNNKKIGTFKITIIDDGSKGNT